MAVYSLAQAKDQLSRLIDEARRDEPVVSLTPTAPEPLTDEYLAELRLRRALRPSLGADSVTLVREMRDEER